MRIQRWPAGPVLTLVASAVLAALVGGCAWLKEIEAPKAKEPRATAILMATSGYSVRGVVHFEQHGDLVRVEADVTGLVPNSVEAIHVHERGDCSAPDASSAGAHFNPTGSPHGAPDHGPHHAGDLPNLQSDDIGAAHMTFSTRELSIGGGGNNILGRAVVIHRGPDDYKSQPAGNSGTRIGCGAIELNNEKDEDE